MLKFKDISLYVVENVLNDFEHDLRCSECDYEFELAELGDLGDCVCDYCGKIHCEVCIDVLHRCEWCGEYFAELIDIERGGVWHRVCYRCGDEHFNYDVCDYCGEKFYENEVAWTNVNGNWHRICEYCYKNINNEGENEN